MIRKKNFFAQPDAPYYLYAPPYDENSGGIRVMHYLCHALNLAGEEAYVLTTTTSPVLRTPSLSNEIQQQHLHTGREPIVIYPEVVTANPLHASNVVRYLLNVPGLLSKEPVNWHATDLIYTHGLDVVPQGMQAGLLQTPMVNAFIYNSSGADDSKRHGKLLWLKRYLGHGGKLQPITDDATEISYRVPRRSPEELSELYRNAEVLYTYEHSTACYEAMLCGCPVVYIPNDIFLPERHGGHLGSDGWAWGTDADELERAKKTVYRVAQTHAAKEEEFWQELDSFIEITQAHARQNAAHAAVFAAHPETRLERAIDAYSKGNYDVATEQLSNVIEMAPDQPLAYAYLAFICAAQGLTEEAGAFIEQALVLAPGRSDLLAGLGEAFLKAGNPAPAAHYLQDAISLQPDLFIAYPALAEALRLNGQPEEAILLLSGAASIPSQTQACIQEILAEMLASRGDITRLTSFCLQASHQPAYHGLGIRLLTRTGGSEETVRREFEAFTQRHLVNAGVPQDVAPEQTHNPLLTIAFVVSDFARENMRARLEALLLHLPSADFRTIIICNDPAAANEETAQRCLMLCDDWIAASDKADIDMANTLLALQTDVLIDLDGPGPRHRLSLLQAATVKTKLTWGDIPAWGLPDIVFACGSDLLPQILPPYACLALPGLGEPLYLPDTPIVALTLADPACRFACLTSANKVDSRSWRLYARLLADTPGSSLLINLGELGEQGQHFIADFFVAAGVAPDRLQFIQARTPEALCSAWNLADVGLAPLHGNGDSALPACLWMDRPFVALAADVPWAARPSALLKAVGLRELIAENEEGYLEIARQLARQRPQTALRQRLRTAIPTPADFAREFAAAISNLCPRSAQ